MQRWRPYVGDRDPFIYNAHIRKGAEDQFESFPMFGKVTLRNVELDYSRSPFPMYGGEEVEKYSSFEAGWGEVVVGIHT